VSEEVSDEVEDKVVDKVEDKVEDEVVNELMNEVEKEVEDKEDGVVDRANAYCHIKRETLKCWVKDRRYIEVAKDSRGVETV
jgi:hypothetical protein